MLWFVKSLKNTDILRVSQFWGKLRYSNVQMKFETIPASFNSLYIARNLEFHQSENL